MRLNHDCIRKLLLYIEDNLVLGSRITLPNSSFNDFETDVILYTAYKLHEAKYIRAFEKTDDTGKLLRIIIYDITWEGHKFLDTIRDNEVWSTTKKILNKVSSASISFVSNIASQVLNNLINQQFKILDTNHD